MLISLLTLITFLLTLILLTLMTSITLPPWRHAIVAGGVWAPEHPQAAVELQRLLNQIKSTLYWFGGAARG
jgi:hypothetical protein